MFDSIRKHQRLLQFVLLILIFPAFVFFGVAGYDRFLEGDRSVAQVGDEKISPQEFAEAQRLRVDQLRRALGTQIDPAMLESLVSRDEILDGLIAQRVLLAEARRLRVAVPDVVLRETIAGFPGLRRPDGSFDIERYKSLVAAQGRSIDRFEAELRGELALQALPEAIAGSGDVPRAVLERIVALRDERRTVRPLLLRPEDFAARVVPTDEQLRRFYDARTELYQVPESARVELVVLDAQTIAAQVRLDAEAVRAYYEQNKARWSTGEQRRASHILLTAPADAKPAERDAARAKAEALVAQLRSGADFAKLAREQSQDPGSKGQGGDLGFFTRETMVKPFADAAFALKDGETSGVVESEFGFHVIRVTGIKPGSVQPFETVRAAIEQEIRGQQAQKLFAESAEQFSNLVYEQPDGLKPAADKFGLRIAVEEVQRSGPVRPPAEGQRPPLANAQLLAAIFAPDSVRAKTNTKAVEVAPGVIAAARVLEHRPASRRRFEQVAGEVRIGFVQQEARRLAREAGEARLKALADGTPADGFGAPRVLTRAAPENVPPQAIEAIFRGTPAKLPGHVGVDLGSAGYALYEIVAIAPADPAVVAQKAPALAQELRGLAGRQDFNDYLEALKARTAIKRHPERLATAVER